MVVGWLVLLLSIHAGNRRLKSPEVAHSGTPGRRRVSVDILTTVWEKGRVEGGRQGWVGAGGECQDGPVSTSHPTPIPHCRNAKRENISVNL